MHVNSPTFYLPPEPFITLQHALCGYLHLLALQQSLVAQAYWNHDYMAMALCIGVLRINASSIARHAQG